MLEYTGHPFVDVGLATMTAFVDKKHPKDLTEEDFEEIAQYIERNYPEPPLRGHLTMAFTSNAWFIQDAYNPNKPDLSPEKRAERQATRQRWADAHIRQWRLPLDPSQTCVFTGLPAASGSLSGSLQAGRAARAQVPLLQGDESINFFVNGDPGLPISPQALLALQFFPLGCAKSGVGLLAVHGSSDDVTYRFTKKFLSENRQNILFAQQEGSDKLSSASRTLKTLLIETLLDIEQQRRREEYRVKQSVSITAYNYNNGKSPELVLYHIPLQVTNFLLLANSAEYKKIWQTIVHAAWEKAPVTKKAKIPVTDFSPRTNFLYEDLFKLPDNASQFIRRYFLRQSYKVNNTSDPRSDYSLQRDLQLVSWDIVELFLQEVVNMSSERIELIRQLADQLADFTRQQGGKRFFRDFYRIKHTNAFLDLLIKTKLQYAKSQQNDKALVFDFDSVIELFLVDEDTLRFDWLLIRDLVLIRMIDQLKDWLAKNPDALPEAEPQEESNAETVTANEQYPLN